MTAVPPQPSAPPGAARVLDAVERWARRFPDAVAVSAADGTLTFAQLCAETRALAGDLAAAGAGPEVPVALCLGRSRMLVPAFLAVWRTGATAVPVDDRHPADRLGFVLQDAGAQLLLGEALPRGAAPPRARRVDRDRDRGGDAEIPGPARPGDCAYLIYTSGTTGWPKGVEITYRGLDAFLAAVATLGLTPGGVGINAVSPAFDGWLWCTLLYLVAGQGVAIVDLTDTDADADGLAERIAALRPRTICLTPSLLVACGEDLPASEVLVVAGEPCPPGLLDRWARDRRVLNVYGPTEATIAATWSDTARGDDPSTIGRALPGYRVHVLDERLAPVPAGTAGELCVAGPAVARGYRNQPELTAARFVLDPVAGDGSLLYRTGDLAHWRTDGTLEFLGRRDDQVKVRGFRVELGEVERTVLRSPGVRAAAAFLTENGEAIGLAVVPAPGTAAADLVDLVGAHCGRQLPDYMRPAVIVVTTALPVTSTGKVDRLALVRRAAEQAAGGGRVPQTDLEREICVLWGELLGRSLQDADANFFEIGGHSLLAAKAVVGLRQRTGLRLTMRHLLAHPTVSGLAAEIEALAAQAAVSPTVAP
jgi:amino acid adenylation domain-containing protein